MRDLTAPEYATVLAQGRPRDADVVRAALVDLLARRALRFAGGSHGAAPERLLVAGPTPEHELPPVLRPARSALAAAAAVEEVDGGPAVRVRDWADALTHVTEGHGYLDGVVRPALIGAGLLDRVRRRFLPGSRWGLTPEGEAVRVRAAADVARARQAVEGAGVDVDPRLAAAALASLGALGVVVLADRDLVAALVDLRRTAVPDGTAGGGDTGAWVVADDGRHGVADDDPFDGLDDLDGGGLDAVDSGTGGGWDGGSDGGSDGGGGDGGGGGGGD